MHPWSASRPISAWLPGGYSRSRRGANRVFRPVIDADRCSKCSMCWVYCPEGIIGRGERYSIDYDYCKGCGVCAEECPRGAITMMREE